LATSPATLEERNEESQLRRPAIPDSAVSLLFVNFRTTEGVRMPELKEVQKRIESIEGLIREIEKVSDPSIASLSKQLVQALMDLHGSGIERMLEIAHRRGDGTGNHRRDGSRRSRE
jgi:hypothetical protein